MTKNPKTLNSSLPTTEDFETGIARRLRRTRMPEDVARPTTDSIHRAATVLANAYGAGLLTLDICPSAEEGVGIKFAGVDGAYAIVECFNDGGNIAMLIHPQKPVEVREVLLEEKELQEFLIYLGEFLR